MLRANTLTFAGLLLRYVPLELNSSATQQCTSVKACTSVRLLKSVISVPDLQPVCDWLAAGASQR